jgi:NAD-dependent dihydropyrimidine dehydrogenase PreA subunit
LSRALPKEDVLPFIIGSPCIDVLDRGCIDECPVDCIYEGERKLYINPNECIDCGACLPTCPVEAISMDRRAPEAEKPFIRDNDEFFHAVLPGRRQPIGDLGGAAKSGPLGVDTPLVAAYVAQG